MKRFQVILTAAISIIAIAFNPFIRFLEKTDEEISEEERDKWDKHNQHLTEEHLVGVHQKNYRGRLERVTAESYTDYFFKTYQLSQYMNESEEHGNILQLGASSGNFIAQYKKRGWNVTGYDYSEIATLLMKKNGINAKKIDLNKKDIFKKELSYAAELRKDISHPTYIFIVNTLQYLKPDVRNLILFDLIDYAAKGSVIIIAGAVDKNGYQVTLKGNTILLNPPNHMASIFAPRTDAKLLLNKAAEKNPHQELLVVRKVG